MTDKRTFKVVNPEVRSRAIECVRSAPPGYIVTVREPSRTLDQNALLWALLGDVSAQVDWHGAKLSADDWKNVFTSSLKKQRVVPGIDGGFVVMGLPTSSMTKEQFGELCELIMCFGAQHGVTFKGEP